MNPHIKIEIHQVEKDGKQTDKYKIKLEYKTRQFNLDLWHPVLLTKHEADIRVMKMAIEFDAETDGFIIANKLSDTGVAK